MKVLLILCLISALVCYFCLAAPRALELEDEDG